MLKIIKANKFLKDYDLAKKEVIILACLLMQ